MQTRMVQQKLTGYIPMVETMTIDCVAASINVMHHNRGQVRSIEVTPGQFMPVKIHYWLPVWEEAKVEYED